MLDLMLDHRAFAQAWPGAPPFLIVEEEGVQFRTKQGKSTSSHTDHSLASLSETGVPRDYPIVTSEGTCTFGDLLRFSLQNFSLNQMEYEWSALAYALFLPPVDKWYTTEGQEITFDRLADRIMRQELEEGVCLGNHRLHALVAFLRVNEQYPILSDEGHRRIMEHMQDVTRRLIGSQHAYGYWDTGWSTGEPPEEEDEHAKRSGFEVLTWRMLVTGHILEWMSMAPAELHPPREVLIRAGQWMVQSIDRIDPERVREDYAFISHAGNALAYWRGKHPDEFMQEYLARQKAAEQAGET
jgi:hypothetical protein